MIQHLEKLILLLLSVKNGNYDPRKSPFDKCYMSLSDIKDINALIDNKPFFDQPVKTVEKCMKNYEMSRNNDTAGSLLDYLPQQKYYRLIGIYLSRETNTSIPQ